MDFLAIAQGNLLSPMVLCFVLGVAAALVRSELSIPDAAAKAMSIYLLFAIGFKGGVEVSRQGFDGQIAAALGLGIALSFILPVIAYQLMRWTTQLSPLDAAAVGAHYGSISIVTFVAATQALSSAGVDYDGYMVAVAAAMEAPAILAALWLVSRDGGKDASIDAAAAEARTMTPVRARFTAPTIPREVLTNGSIVLLVGSFFIGLASGEEGKAAVSGFIEDPFKGVLCLFLLDMGLLAGRYLRQSISQIRPEVLAVGVYMPLLSAAIAAPLGAAIGLSAGSLALFVTLAASASYIAVPSALRIALPDANPGIYLTLSLGVTFPFNLAIGIPIYIAVAQALA